MTGQTEILSEILSELKRGNRNARLWDIHDVADYVGISNSAAYRLVSKAGFPRAVKLEGVPQRWLPAEVRAFAERRKERRAVI